MLAKFLDVALTEFARVGNAKCPPPFSVGCDYHHLAFICEKNGPLANEVGPHTGCVCIVNSSASGQNEGESVREIVEDYWSRYHVKTR